MVKSVTGDPVSEAHLNRREKVGRIDDGTAIEEDKLHPERFRDRLCGDRFSATLRSIEQDIESIFKQYLELFRNDGIEVNSLRSKLEQILKFDFDRTAILPRGFLYRGDFDAAACPRHDPRIIAQHDLRRTFSVQMRRAKSKTA
ncbi:MAG: hypothetical protein AAFX06_23050 [Planctomycetota bacterium]